MNKTEKMGCGASAARKEISSFTLPHDDPDRPGRTKLLTEYRAAYTLDFDLCDKGLPPCTLKLPCLEKDSSAVREAGAKLGGAALVKGAVVFKKVANVVGAVVDTIASAFTTITPQASKTEDERFRDALSDYYEMFSGVGEFPTPLIMDDWRSDRVFGWLRVNGVNPTLIAQCAPSAPLPMTNVSALDAKVKNLLPTSHTVATMHAAGRLFVCDYRKEMPGVMCDPKLCGLVPVVLLFLNDEKQIMPLAIELSLWPEPTPAPQDTCVFTPLDDPLTWLSAKVHVNSVDISYNTIVPHVLRTHMCMESVYISMRRNLSVRHPIHELLIENFWFTTIINDFGRKLLLVEDGPLATARSFGPKGMFQFIKNAGENVDFASFHVPSCIKKRGLADTVNLPEFYWRDDATELWGHVATFVEESLARFYVSAKDVTDDIELRDWFQEMTASRKEKRGCGFLGLSAPRTPQDVNTFVTMILYNCSAGHATVNNGQYEYFAFVPQAPGIFRMPLERMKNAIAPGGKPITLVEFVNAMPSAKEAETQTATAKILTQKSDDLLGSYRADFFKKEASSATALGKFQRSLKAMTDRIDRRQSFIKYNFLNPAQIAQGIAI